MLKIKSIYKASFEESTQLVTDKLVEANMSNTAPNIVKKRVLGMIVTIFLSVGCYFLIDFTLDKNAIIFRIVGKSQLYLVVMILFGMYQLKTLFDIDKKKYSLSIVYNRAIFSIAVVLGVLVAAFSLDAVNIVLRYVYSILLIFVLILINKKMNKQMKKSMFKVKPPSSVRNKLEGNWKILQQIGSVIVLIGFIWNLFVSAPDERSDWMTTLLINLLPLIPMVIFSGILFFKSYFIEGYYIEKYPEEYRLKYGYSNKDWYGEKSKQYKQAKANGKEE